jgi:hypothetical protein
MVAVYGYPIRGYVHLVTVELDAKLIELEELLKAKLRQRA